MRARVYVCAIRVTRTNRVRTLFARPMMSVGYEKRPRNEDRLSSRIGLDGCVRYNIAV